MMIEKIRELTAKVESEFGELNDVQLNWKRDPKSWSIAQLLDHLIVSNKRYFEVLRKASDTNYQSSLWERINPFTRYAGRSLVRNNGPDSTKKYVAPMLYRPANKKSGVEIILNFRLMQDELFNIFSSLIERGYTQRIITSPLAGLVTLTVEDTINLIIGHEYRHLNQAIEIKNDPDFPK